MRAVGWVAELLRTRTTGVRIVHCRRGPYVPSAVALTFDDGPSTEWTPEILDVLRAHGAHATFFVLGAAVDGRETILRRAVAEGHELGNHAYSHADLAALDDEAIRDELEQTNALVESSTGSRPRLFRPPYAGYDVRVARIAQDVGLSPTVLRSIDPADWRERDPERIAGVVLDVVRPGSIVCLHDGVPPRSSAGTPDRRPTIEATREILASLPARGLASTTVSDLLGLRGGAR